MTVTARRIAAYQLTFIRHKHLNEFEETKVKDEGLASQYNVKTKKL